MALLSEGVRAGDNVDLKGGVSDDDRRSCDAFGRARPAPRRRGRGPPTTSTSQAATATTAGGPATLLAARATAPLPEGVRTGDDVGFKGGVCDDGRRACHNVGRTGHGASPGGGEGWRCRRRQGRHRRRRQEYLRHRRPRAPQRLMEGGGPAMTSASRAAVARLAGGSATPSAARATAPLLEVVRTGNDAGLKGSNGYASKRACDAGGRAGHGASPGGGEGRRRRWPQGRRRRRWQEGMQRRRPHGTRRLSRRG